MRKRPGLLISVPRPNYKKPKIDIVTIAKGILEDSVAEFCDRMGVFNLKKDNLSTDDARLVIMAHKMWSDSPTTTFEKKPGGLTSGLVAVVQGEPRRFVKSFLGEGIGGASNIVELFTYKLLEGFNFGAKVEARRSAAGLSFLVSEDIGSAEEASSFGDDAKRILHEAVQENVAENNQCKSKILGLEILAKVLRIGDASNNKGNYAAVDRHEEGMSPVVIDFHLDPTLGTALTRRGSNLQFAFVGEALATAESAQGFISVGLTAAMVGSEIEEDVYRGALGHVTDEKWRQAQQFARDYCEAFVGQEVEDRESFDREFNLDDLKEYSEEVEGNLAKLVPDQSGRSSSCSEVVAGFFALGEVDVFLPRVPMVEDEIERQEVALFHPVGVAEGATASRVSSLQGFFK
jgi:TolA-binding protein